uniref:Uncharacterized protein n=1 Tax=Ixodes ricinus TaxID=34613 RepID=A0A6B0V026_IXORI
MADFGGRCRPYRCQKNKIKNIWKRYTVFPTPKIYQVFLNHKNKLPQNSERTPTQNEKINGEKHGVGYPWGRHSKTLSKTGYKLRDAETDTADRGHRKFAFHDAINTREPATNLPVTGTNIARTNHGQKSRNPQQTHMLREQIPQIANAAKSYFTMQYSTRRTNSRKMEIAHADRGQKRGNPL